MSDNDSIDTSKAKEQVQHQLEELKSEEKVLNTWTKSSKDLIEQYKNKFDAFKAMADESGYIDKNNFKLGGDVQTEIFKKIDTDGDGKISKEEWNSGWAKLDTQVQENHHKQTIAQQKMLIMDALESRVEPGKHLDQPLNPGSYSNILDKFRSASTLDELSSIFSQPIQRSPFHPKENEAPVVAQINFDIKKPSRKTESILGQYKTPSKEAELIQDGSGRGSYINSFNSKKPSAGKSPVTRFHSNFASPSVGFLNQGLPQKQQENSSINSKVQQSMNLQLEVKDLSRTNKRKEDLQNFMGKIGLGKYEAPKVTINLEQSNSNQQQQHSGAFERLRMYVNGQGPTPASSRGVPQQAGLSELVNDRSFASATFKQQVKAYKKERKNEGRSRSNGRESANLVDQSLKSFHLKLVHHQKQGSFSSSGLKFARN